MFSKLKETIVSFYESRVEEYVSWDELIKNYDNVTGECEFLSDGKMTRLKHRGIVIAVLTCKRTHAVVMVKDSNGIPMLAVLRRKNGQNI